jgi:hypothetical protein
MSGKKGMHRRVMTSPAAAAAISAMVKGQRIVEELQKHVFGERKMTSTQVTAGLGLLRKVCPDINHIQHSGEVNHILIANAAKLMEALRQ